MGWGYLGILLGVCALFSAVGFYKFVYFLSIGYGFAVAAGAIAVMSIVLASGWAGNLWWLLILMTLLFVAYGARLSGFLLVREIKSASYRKTLKDVAGDNKKMPFFVLLVIWICVAVLYTAQLSPMFFRFYNGAKDVVLPLIGIGISLCGLLLEAAADRQKSEQKKQRPDMVATQGLYKIVRCPNYLGEIIFWTGVFVGGISAYTGVGQWLTASLAYVCIVYIMFNGAQRLEKRQMERYKDSAEYRAYADKTPILLPLLPIYHLNKIEKSEKKK